MNHPAQTLSINESAANETRIQKVIQGCAFMLSVFLLSGCGSGSSSTDTEVLPVSQLNDEQSYWQLKVSFTTPDRLKLIGSALTATATVGGIDQIMDVVGDSFESTLNLPNSQQVQVYVGVRRTEDSLLLAAAAANAWLDEEGTTVSLPEQLFVYDFDQDGDGVDNIVEIERGTSPASISLDYDADGIPDETDRDDDNDGVADEVDAFPFNAQEFADTDGDGIGNKSDTDDDGDGVLDENDAFPTDASEVRDSDLDGVGDNADTDADGNGIEDDQEDSDGDGVPDPIDLFPENDRESADMDGDGIGDNEDPDDNNNGVRDNREGAQIIVPYVDNPRVVLDGRDNSDYVNGIYYSEWGKATNTDSLGHSLMIRNLQVNNSGRYTDFPYTYNRFKMLHDGEYLYVRIFVSDEELEDWFNDSVNSWEDDSVELYFDVGYDQADAYGDNDYQRIFRFRDSVSDPILDGFHSATGLSTEYVTSYRHENSANRVYSHIYEIRVKLSSINLDPGDTFGLEVAVNIDNDGGGRDAKYGWWAPSGMDVAWFRPSAFGKAKLQPKD